MIDEMQQKYKKEREIKLSDYFKITKEAQRKYLTRSGSADLKKVKEHNKRKDEKTLNYTDEDGKNLSAVDINEFEEEVKEIKKKIFNNKESKEEIPQMDDVLIEKKKKIAIKMNQIKFNSIKEVFETRNKEKVTQEDKDPQEEQRTF